MNRDANVLKSQPGWGETGHEPACRKIEMINLAGILRSKVVRDTIPVFFSDKDPPVVSYKYSSTIRAKLFNHKQTVDQIKFKNCKLDSDGFDGACDCENSELKQ